MTDELGRKWEGSRRGLIDVRVVNRPQMDIKSITYDIRNWQKNYFSTYPPTLIHLSHRFASESKQIFWLLSQPLPTVNMKYYEYALHWDLFPNKKRTTELCSLVLYTPQAQSPFWLPKPASEHAHARLLTRLSWSCPVLLLPDDTHRKPITSITAVLLPFVTCLLTLPRVIPSIAWRD
jgi:hypothetical protein